MTISLRDAARTIFHRSRLVQHALAAPVLANQSFSQCGEDVILRFAFQSLGIWRPSYLDIGAHDPFMLSNSALFHHIGGRGVNIEPNPTLFRAFERRRAKDVNLNIGVASVAGTLDFYVMDNPELSTFDRATAEAYQAQGVRVREVVPVPVLPINEILERYAPAGGFDLMSIDVEGVEEEILRSLDYERFAPLAMCVETVEFATAEKGGEEISRILRSHGYFVYADTFINTIFFHEAKYRRMRSAMLSK